MNGSTRARVFVERIEPEDVEVTVRQGLEWINWQAVVSPGARVFLKPNFTYPFYKKGVTTSPAFLEAVVRVLAERTDKIAIGESDGGAHAWSADDAFMGHDLHRLRDAFGVELVNLTRGARERATAEVAGSRITLELPTRLLHEVDVFITVPVPKVHVMTGVSLGFKNQWGCLPDVKRLREHHHFRRAVLAVNKLLRPKMALFDGTYFLNRSGPMAGDPVHMKLIVASNDVGAGSAACCEIMQIDPRGVPHLALAMQEGMFPRSLADAVVNKPLESFRGERFYLKRTWLNWLTLGAFRSQLATRLIYDSRLAKPAHQLLYLIRGAPRDVAPQW